MQKVGERVLCVRDERIEVLLILRMNLIIIF
jgi:hypothetical protein